MKPLYNQEQYNSAKTTDKLLCECYECNQPFLATKNRIIRFLTHNIRDVKFCSRECHSNWRIQKLKINCSNCSLDIYILPNQMKRSINHFCSKTCSTSYNNKNKTTGNRRSKLETWLEEQLTNLYPTLPIDFNKKDTIGSELDIYIPSLNLAIELNGIFHYEPIYGINKLDQIKSNDISKSKACFDAKIDLCIIDTSAQKYVKPSTSKKYLDIIINIVNERLLII
jgi:transposase-like protein